MTPRVRLLLPLLALLSTTACDHVYPLVANGYSKSVAVTSLDDKGKGGYSHTLAPGQCLEVMHERPNLTQIVVSRDHQTTTYDRGDILRALNNADPASGTFIVNESGLAFVQHYNCSHAE